VTSVLQVITSTDRRGAEVFACELAEPLADAGLTVRTVALAAGRTASRLDVEPLGPSPVGIVALRRLRALARASDVVVAHGSRTLPACAIATLGLPTPFVYRVIGDPRHWSASGLRRLRVRLFLSRASAVVALWPAAAAGLVANYGVPVARARVIPNGVDARRFVPPPPARRAAARQRFGLDPGAPVVVYLGALSPEKNVVAAIASIGELPLARLLVAGDGPDRDDLERRAAHVAPGQVRFAGSLDDPSAALAAADVVVLPSLTEGMPAVAIEAGLMGLPVVATGVGAVGEVVRDGHTGLLVPAGDQPALVAALGAALDGGDRLGVEARRWCLDRFAMGPVGHAWAVLLEEVAALE